MLFHFLLSPLPSPNEYLVQLNCSDLYLETISLVISPCSFQWLDSYLFITAQMCYLPELLLNAL